MDINTKKQCFSCDLHVVIISNFLCCSTWSFCVATYRFVCVCVDSVRASAGEVRCGEWQWLQVWQVWQGVQQPAWTHHPRVILLRSSQLIHSLRLPPAWRQWHFTTTPVVLTIRRRLSAVTCLWISTSAVHSQSI